MNIGPRSGYVSPWPRRRPPRSPRSHRPTQPPLPPKKRPANNTPPIYDYSNFYKIFTPFQNREEAKFLSTLSPHIPNIMQRITKITNIPLFYIPDTREQSNRHLEFILSLVPHERAFSYYFSKEYQAKILDFFYFHQKLRHSFRKLAYLWRRKKWSQHQLNTDDPFTMCEPDQPIRLLDSNSKGVYLFEAASLLKHIRTSILTHDGLYDEPAFPKNPLTNIRFTVGQLHTIYSTCKSLALTHWAFELFRLSRFSLASLQTEFGYQLKKHALNATFSDYSSLAFRQYFIDFIEQEYIIADEMCPSSMYKWSLLHNSDSRYLIAWINLAKESALADIQDEYDIKPKNDVLLHKKSALLIDSEDYFHFSNYYYQRTSPTGATPLPPLAAILQQLFGSSLLEESDSSSD